MSDKLYVRTEMLPERAPPASTTGAIGWMRQNLFNGWSNSLLTVVAVGFVVWLLMHILPWFFSPTWDSGSLTQCREMATEAGREGGACWGVIRERWPQMLFGFYPEHLRLRPVLAFGLLFVALIPVLFSMISRRMNWFLLAAVLLAATFFAPSSVLLIAVQVLLAAAVAYLGWTVISTDRAARAQAIEAGAARLPNPLIFTAIYVFLMPWLLWGGPIWSPIGAALGFVIAWAAFKALSPAIGTLGAIILAAAATLVWWLVINGYFVDGLQAILPLGLEPVESRLFGGLLLSVTIGVTAIAVSLPLGIMLALGRRPSRELPEVQYVEVATEPVVIRTADAGGLDLLILDGEAAPAGGMGVCRQLKDELYQGPPILVIVARPQDAWLATWSKADGVVSQPLDPMQLASVVTDLLRPRVTLSRT